MILPYACSQSFVKAPVETFIVASRLSVSFASPATQQVFALVTEKSVIALVTRGGGAFNGVTYTSKRKVVRVRHTCATLQAGIGQYTFDASDHLEFLVHTSKS